MGAFDCEWSVLYSPREKKEMEEQIEGLKDELLIFSDIKQLKKELKSIKTTSLQNGPFDDDDLFFFKWYICYKGLQLL